MLDISKLAWNLADVWETVAGILPDAPKIFTEEVEAAIVDLDGVTDVLVVGIPDPQWGQAVEAAVSVKPGKDVISSDVIAQVKSRLASYKAPAVRQLAEQSRARSADGTVTAGPRL